MYWIVGPKDTLISDKSVQLPLIFFYFVIATPWPIGHKCCYAALRYGHRMALQPLWVARCTLAGVRMGFW